MVGVAAPLITAAIVFGANSVWGALHTPAANGTIDYKSTVDAFITRADFYRRFVNIAPPPPTVRGDGLVIDVQTEAEHASSCRLVWTARDVGDQTTIRDLVDQPVNDIAGGTGCSGEKQIWLPWPCVAAQTQLQFEIGLLAGSKQLDSATSEVFPVGGGC